MTANSTEHIGLRIGRLIKLTGNGRQDGFADALGICRPYVSKLVHCRNEPSKQLIISICKVFNVRREWLKTGEGQIFDDGLAARQEENKKVDEFVEVLREYANGLREMSDTLNSIVERYVRSKREHYEK